jgi:hypothetical protein
MVYKIFRRLWPQTIVLATFFVFGVAHAQSVQSSQQNDAKTWNNANTEVGKFQRGHIDLLKAERGRLTLDPATQLGGFVEDPKAPELTEQAARHATLKLYADLVAGQPISALERASRDIQLLSLQQNTHKLWIEAVSAKEQLSIQRRIMEAASVSLELARRMEKIGNWGRNRLIEIEISYEETRNQLVQADQKAFNTRQSLFTQIGSNNWRLPSSLPAPTSAAGLSELLIPAGQQEFELIARHPQLSLLEKEAQYYERIVGPQMLGEWQKHLDDLITSTTSLTRSIPTLDRTKILWSHDLEKAISLRAEVQRVKIKLQADLQQAREHLRATHTQASEISVKLQRLYGSAEDETLMRYNGMFISTWELIAKAQDKMRTELAVSQAKQSFWIALTDFRAFIAGAPYNGPGTISSDSSNERATGKGH